MAPPSFLAGSPSIALRTPLPLLQSQTPTKEVMSLLSQALYMKYRPIATIVPLAPGQ